MSRLEDGTPEQTHVAFVTTNFFRLLGGRIVLGRDFYDEDGIPHLQRRRELASSGRRRSCRWCDSQL